MTIRVLCDATLLEGKQIKKAANYWHGSGSSNSFLLNDGSVFGFKQNGESAFYYEGRTFYDASYDKVMEVLGGQAVELGLVSQTMYNEFKANKLARERIQVEEADRRLFEELKLKFEPKGKTKLAEAAKMLEEIVCTEGVDAGVVMLSSDGPCHPEPDPNNPGQTIQVYNHDYFSPLGDALIALHQKLKED